MDVPAEITARLRSICLGLPEAYEEDAWTGVRWCVRKRTFAHVLMIDDAWPPAYARASGLDGRACVLMFRSAGPELAVLRGSGPPFFAPPWRDDEVGLHLGDDVDWIEIAELLTESFCAQAPQKLRAAVDRPHD